MNLRERVASLEKELGEERLQGRLRRLEVLVNNTKRAVDNDLENTHQGVGGLWRSVETPNKLATHCNDQLEGLTDDAEQMQPRSLEIEEASMRAEDRVIALEEGSSTVQNFRERVSQVVSGVGAWTAHVSLLPTASQQFPFEKDTAAYKRSLSRGLYQMIVIPDTDCESFTAAVSLAFSEILQGRPWKPLIARICDVGSLRGLPMLRQLPEWLNARPFDAEFLKKNCAIVDSMGKILDIYIAMVDHTLSWPELNALRPFIPGLEASWIYDPYLDGHFEDNIYSATPHKLYTAGDILPSWSPSLKRKASDISKTTSFGSASQSGLSPKDMRGETGRLEIQPRYVI